MNKHDIKRIKSMYRRCWPSIVAEYEGVQYYCSNWHSIEALRKKLGLDHIRDCKYIRFELENWQGTEDQLMALLTTCDQAKRAQVIKFGAVGWYVTWSENNGLNYEVTLCD